MAMTALTVQAGSDEWAYCGSDNVNVSLPDELNIDVDKLPLEVKERYLAMHYSYLAYQACVDSLIGVDQAELADQIFVTCNPLLEL